MVHSEAFDMVIGQHAEGA